MTPRAKVSITPDALVTIGTGAVIGGGLVAAITGPLGWRDGSWLAAYLVLVCGVAQIVIGVAYQVLVDRPAPPRWLVPTAWNLANAMVIAGTLLGTPPLVHVGGAGVLAVIIMVLRAVRTAPGHRVVAWGCRIFLIVLAVSVPVGSVLAQLRAG